MFKVEDQVFIRKNNINKKGIIKEIDEENKKYKITYFNEEGNRQIEEFKNKDITKYKEFPQTLEIKIKYFDKQLTKIEQHGNWIDLRSAQKIELKAFERTLIPLGVAMQLPQGYEALLVPRSSTFKNFGILQTNTP
ncbi:MAG: hypothetical protein PHI40_08435, partial [Caldisericia bacterium]|nr:hypothetical protein [Caldisericia bacterium]